MVDSISASNLADDANRAKMTPGDATESIRPTTPESARARPAAVNSLVPDWAPWGVLGALLSLGLLGGTGLMPMPDLRRLTAPAPFKGAVATKVELAARNTQKSAAIPSVASSAAGDEKIEVFHIVVSHGGTQLGKHHHITRTAAEAKKRAEEARARALGGADFTALIAEYSDEPKASGRNGRIGPFRKKHAIQPFSEVAFALKINEISAVTETDLGFHVIKRTK